MKKTLLLASLFLSFGLLSQAADISNMNVNATEESDLVSNQEESSHQHYANNQEETQKSCENIESGTYMQYHPNGMLKSFSIVK